MCQPFAFRTFARPLNITPHLIILLDLDFIDYRSPAWTQRLALLLAERAEDTHAAERETDDSSECGNQHDVRTEMKEVGHHRGDRECEAQYIQPQGRVNFPVEVFPQAELEKERGQADRRNYEER